MVQWARVKVYPSKIRTAGLVTEATRRTMSGKQARRTSFTISRLGRGEALSVIESFEAELSRRQPPPLEARRLLPLLTEGLRELRRERVPENWL